MTDMDTADRLSPLDSWWFDIEREAQQLHVGSVLLFEGPAPSHAQLTAATESRLDLVPRYRQRVLRVPLEIGRPVWADDARFRIDDHVRHATLPRPGTEESLRDLVAHIMSQHLDLSRPLWETWLVDGLEGGRWAMVNKTHHAMIDGISGGRHLGRASGPRPPRRSASGYCLDTAGRALARQAGHVCAERHVPRPSGRGQTGARPSRQGAAAFHPPEHH